MKKPIRKLIEDPWGFNNKPTKRISIFTPVPKNVFSKRTIIQPVKNNYNFFPKKYVDNYIVDNKKVVNKDMNWMQAKKKYPYLNPHTDSDKDGLMNMYDCKPFDKFKQEEFPKEKKDKENPSDFKKGVMSERAKRKYAEKMQREKVRIKKEANFNKFKVYATQRIKIERPLNSKIDKIVREKVLPKFNKQIAFDKNLKRFEEKELPIILKKIPVKQISEKYIEGLDNTKDIDKTKSLLNRRNVSLLERKKVINSSFNKKTAEAKSQLTILATNELDINNYKLKLITEREKNVKKYENEKKRQYQKNRRLKRMYSDTDEMFTPEGLKYLKRIKYDPINTLKEKKEEKKDVPLFKNEIIDYEKEKEWYNKELIKEEKKRRYPELKVIEAEKTPVTKFKTMQQKTFELQPIKENKKGKMYDFEEVIKTKLVEKPETFIEKSARKVKDLLYPPESEFEDVIEKDVSDRLMKEEIELKDIQKKVEIAEKEITREEKMNKFKEAKEKKIRKAEDKIEKLEEIKEKYIKPEVKEKDTEKNTAQKLIDEA